jgi:hypothetical protein
MKTSYEDITHNLAKAFKAFIAMVLSMVYMMKTLLNTLLAMLSHVERSILSISAAVETYLHAYKKVSTTSQAFTALVLFVVCMTMTLLTTLVAMLSHAERSILSISAAEETYLHNDKKASTAKQASDDDSFHDTMEESLKSPPRTERYSVDTTQESLKSPRRTKCYSVDTTPVKSSNKKQTAFCPLQSPTFGPSKKQERAAAIQRARISMQPDLQRVNARKQKKEMEEAYKRAK